MKTYFNFNFREINQTQEKACFQKRVNDLESKGVKTADCLSANQNDFDNAYLKFQQNSSAIMSRAAQKQEDIVFGPVKKDDSSSSTSSSERFKWLPRETVDQHNTRVKNIKILNITPRFQKQLNIVFWEYKMDYNRVVACFNRCIRKQTNGKF